MSDSLGDILKNRNSSIPKEIKVIKDYVSENFKKEVNVTVSADKIKIETSNSALAGELRFRIYDIQRLLRTKKKIIILIV